MQSSQDACSTPSPSSLEAGEASVAHSGNLTNTPCFIYCLPFFVSHSSSWCFLGSFPTGALVSEAASGRPKVKTLPFPSSGPAGLKTSLSHFEPLLTSFQPLDMFLFLKYTQPHLLSGPLLMLFPSLGHILPLILTFTAVNVCSFFWYQFKNSFFREEWHPCLDWFLLLYTSYPLIFIAFIIVCNYIHVGTFHCLPKRNVEL